MGGEDLAVQVGDAHGIVIHKIQRTDARPGKSLHNIAAHAAQTKYSHSCLAEPGNAFVSKQKSGAGILVHEKTSFAVCIILSRKTIPVKENRGHCIC
jgi:hypothetical protein